MLAFRAIVDNLSQVVVIMPGSSSWTALTRDRTNGAVASIAWSHDGGRIYFDREWGPGRIYSIGPLSLGGGRGRLVDAVRLDIHEQGHGLLPTGAFASVFVSNREGFVEFRR